MFENNLFETGAIVSMPVGAPIETTLAVRDRVAAAAEAVLAETGGDAQGIGVYTLVEDTRINVRTYLQPPRPAPIPDFELSPGGIYDYVAAYFAPEVNRPVPTREFTRMWRERVGNIAEARSIRYESSWGGPGSASLEIRLSHADTGVLERAAQDLAARLDDYQPVRDSDDGFTPGKDQLEFRLTEEGRAVGLTSEEVAAQVRAAFFGIEALAQQEGRNEVSVRVRLPREERASEADIETMLIRTPDGGSVPLFEIASVERGKADSKIVREDGFRIVTVSADVEPRSETNQVIAAVTAETLPRLQEDYPGLGYSLEGRQAAQRDTMNSFFTFSIPLALVIIYGLLAIPFRSYFQPMIVMMAIPFGFVGAVLGHLIMGMSLSIISVFGIIALGGVVINAGIVMIDYANKARATGAPAFDAMWRAGKRRFRPILLTTLTTFGGLAPMIFETSRQAKFLIPMAVSLGYGIVFATAIILFLIPCLYMILDDLGRLAGAALRLWRQLTRPGEDEEPDPAPPPPEEPEHRPVAAE